MHYLLVVIDVFTRYLYVIGIRNKTDDTVTEAMQHIINSDKPEIIQCDNGSEFISNKFRKLMNNNNIEIQYIDVGNHHALGVVDRACLTIRQLINKYRITQHTQNYINVLDKLVHNYNNTYHSTIKSTPSHPDSELIKKIYDQKYRDAKATEQKFNVGDEVRHLLQRKTFEKGSNPNWSATVHKIISKKEHSYTLDNGNSYKFYELQKVESPFVASDANI